MDLRNAVIILKEEAEIHRRAALAFARNQAASHDVFDAQSGQKFHQGASDAYRVVSLALQLLLQNGGSFEAALVTAQSSAL